VSISTDVQIELAERIKDEEDLFAKVKFWETSSNLWSAMVDYLVAAQLGFIDGTELAQEALHGQAYKAGYDRLLKAGVDLSKFPKPKGEQ
jgi:hypothetical protein